MQPFPPSELADRNHEHEPKESEPPVARDETDEEQGQDSCDRVETEHIHDDSVTVEEHDIFLKHTQWEPVAYDVWPKRTDPERKEDEVD